jgi:hypothetical protein
MTLPPFVPVPIGELRELWLKYRGNEDVRRLILEVQRGRNVLLTVEDHRAIVQKVWAAKVGGTLVALETLRVLLLEERWRAGDIGGSRGS